MENFNDPSTQIVTPFVRSKKTYGKEQQANSSVINVYRQPLPMKGNQQNFKTNTGLRRSNSSKRIKSFNQRGLSKGNMNSMVNSKESVSML